MSPPAESKKWFENYVDDIWKRRSLCNRRPELPWTADFSPSVGERSVMAAICMTCPVLKDCADYAHNSHGGAGVEGGFYAGVYIPWKSETGGLSRENRAVRADSRTTLRRLIRRLSPAKPRIVEEPVIVDVTVVEIQILPDQPASDAAESTPNPQPSDRPAPEASQPR
jgi:hypothetical protein